MMDGPSKDFGSPGNRESRWIPRFFMSASAAPPAASGRATCGSRTMRSRPSPRFLGLSEDDSSGEFTRLRSNRQGLSLIEKENHECIMLEGDACRIHPVKPEQCAGFPNKWNFPGWRKVCEAIPVPVETITPGP